MASESSNSRREKRQNTLKTLELEQQSEDAKDVLLTVEQRNSLLESFHDVKTVFTDLDSFDIEDDEPTPRVANAPNLPISPPVAPSGPPDSDAENEPASPSSSSFASSTIRPTTRSLHRTMRRSASDLALSTTPPLDTTTSHVPTSFDASDQAVKDNIDKAAARWKQKGIRSPLRGVFDQQTAATTMSPPESSTGRVRGRVSRKRSRSEDPSHSYVQRQRAESIVGLGMSFGMAASDLRSSPTRRGTGQVSPPPLRLRSNKRIKLAVKAAPVGEVVPGEVVQGEIAHVLGGGGAASVDREEELGAMKGVDPAYTQESMVVCDSDTGGPRQQ